MRTRTGRVWFASDAPSDRLGDSLSAISTPRPDCSPDVWRAGTAQTSGVRTLVDGHMTPTGGRPIIDRAVKSADNLLLFRHRTAESGEHAQQADAPRQGTPGAADRVRGEALRRARLSPHVGGRHRRRARGRKG